MPRIMKTGMFLSLANWRQRASCSLQDHLTLFSALYLALHLHSTAKLFCFGFVHINNDACKKTDKSDCNKKIAHFHRIIIMMNKIFEGEPLCIFHSPRPEQRNKKVEDQDQSPTSQLRRLDRINSWPPYKKHLWLNGFPMSKKQLIALFHILFVPKSSEFRREKKVLLVLHLTGCKGRKL